jgi:hypothetical protein
MTNPQTTTRTLLKNDNGAFTDGDAVSFEVENEISGGYCWDNHGTLRIKGKEWVIKTRQGTVTIGKGYDAYINTIRPQVSNPYKRPA